MQRASRVSSLHNESANIYSHLLGALLFLALPIWTYWLLSSRHATATAADYVVFSTFYYGVAICFYLSAT